MTQPNESTTPLRGWPPAAACRPRPGDDTEESSVKVTVLPYMGPPTEPPKKHRKSAEAIGTGTRRTQPRIREFEE